MNIVVPVVVLRVEHHAAEQTKHTLYVILLDPLNKQITL